MNGNYLYEKMQEENANYSETKLEITVSGTIAFGFESSVVNNYRAY